MPRSPQGDQRHADDTYSDEEAAKRRDATIRAMIGMKPKPRPSTKPKQATPKRPK